MLQNPARSRTGIQYESGDLRLFPSAFVALFLQWLQRLRSWRFAAHTLKSVRCSSIIGMIVRTSFMVQQMSISGVLVVSSLGIMFPAGRSRSMDLHDRICSFLLYLLLVALVTKRVESL